jgi:predicted DNA-binding ribbon-helix-helix protein
MPSSCLNPVTAQRFGALFEAMKRKRRVRSRVRKHSIRIGSRGSNVSLEDGFWTALREIPIVKNVPTSTLAFRIDQKRRRTNLPSAVRLFILDFYRK